MSCKFFSATFMEIYQTELNSCTQYVQNHFHFYWFYPYAALSFSFSLLLALLLTLEGASTTLSSVYFNFHNYVSVKEKIAAVECRGRRPIIYNKWFFYVNVFDNKQKGNKRIMCYILRMCILHEAMMVYRSTVSLTVQ